MGDLVCHHLSSMDGTAMSPILTSLETRPRTTDSMSDPTDNMDLAMVLLLHDLLVVQVAVVGVLP